MNIKDPEVNRLARALAARRQTTLTGAVREALAETLARDEAAREGIADRLLALGTASRQIGEPLLTDADLYDGDGLPR
ncbi:type II toxin-antitoxin system VapB family antitoxin [Occultella gossypii]|nr:type II toxin-antitoxin system VapB family antitoxin [Occultella gossypii]